MSRPLSHAALYQGVFDVPTLREWLWNQRATFGHPSVDLATVFLSPQFAEHSGLLLSLIHDELNPSHLVGCTSPSVIVNTEEFEDANGFSLGMYHLPGAELETTYFHQGQVESGQEPGYWNEQTGITDPNGWLVFADPFRLDLEAWLKQWNRDFTRKPILGGLASGPHDRQSTEVYLDDQVHTQGGVGIAFQGRVYLRNVISQGCNPIGEPWIVTKTDQNVLIELGNRPAYEVLMETLNTLPPPLAAQSRGNLFVGLVIDEYHESFGRGDFLIRNLLGADPDKGILAVGALPRPGQTLQFQLRSPDAASEDLDTLLPKLAKQLDGDTIHGAILCTCNGRGQRLFGQAHHDARLLNRHFPGLGVTGFFCNGELGPVGGQNFLHGYTASIALLTSSAPDSNPA